MFVHRSEVEVLGQLDVVEGGGLPDDLLSLSHPAHREQPAGALRQQPVQGWGPAVNGVMIKNTNLFSFKNIFHLTKAQNIVKINVAIQGGSLRREYWGRSMRGLGGARSGGYMRGRPAAASPPPTPTPAPRL